MLASGKSVTSSVVTVLDSIVKRGVSTSLYTISASSSAKVLLQYHKNKSDSATINKSLFFFIDKKIKK
ncbi:MAG: hypothetical protein LBF15_02445 [Candidatus Peribacteria bacterium]|nr:hypothetical protein [Candidatus Peribacteria bacterium]